MASHIPVGLSVPPRDLTPTTGARTTRLRRPHQCRSSRAPLLIAHEFELAPRSHAHATSSRPPHPASRFVTIGRNVPLAEAGCASIVVICPTAQDRRVRHFGATGKSGMVGMRALPVGHQSARRPTGLYNPPPRRL